MTEPISKWKFWDCKKWYKSPHRGAGSKLHFKNSSANCSQGNKKQYEKVNNNSIFIY